MDNLMLSVIIDNKVFPLFLIICINTFKHFNSHLFAARHQCRFPYETKGTLTDYFKYFYVSFGNFHVVVEQKGCRKEVIHFGQSTKLTFFEIKFGRGIGRSLFFELLVLKVETFRKNVFFFINRHYHA